MEVIDMKITIIYDNTTVVEGLTADWGFACLVEFDSKNILFDTGGKGEILLANMEKLKIDPEIIDLIFISHSHWDHTGGVSDILKKKNARLYIPKGYDPPSIAKDVITATGPVQIAENIHSTGVLENIEQSLVVKTAKGVVIIAGCSHPGVANILTAASQYGKCYALIGGLHGFDEFALLDELTVVCPTHCTRHIDEIKKKYPKKYIEGGAGRVIEI
jgi:7,8-dihydropterin-6-yl-methyl-4-(beta-D-ribofuranosyl)aminobenzene 5'-phosphate synthase